MPVCINPDNHLYRQTLILFYNIYIYTKDDDMRIALFFNFFPVSLKWFYTLLCLKKT